MGDGAATRSLDCTICGRLILPGEPVQQFVDPDRGRRHHPTCPLCQRQALERGWQRADAASGHDADSSAPAA